MPCCLKSGSYLLCLSKHSGIYRPVLFLIKTAQNVICLLSCQAQDMPTHTADSMAKTPTYPKQKEADPFQSTQSQN